MSWPVSVASSLGELANRRLRRRNQFQMSTESSFHVLVHSPVRADLRKRCSLCGENMVEKTFRCEVSVWFPWNFCEGGVTGVTMLQPKDKRELTRFKG